MQTLYPRDAILRNVEIWDDTYDVGLRIGELIRLEEFVTEQTGKETSAIQIMGSLETLALRLPFQMKILELAFIGGGMLPIKAREKTAAIFNDINNLFEIPPILTPILMASLVGGKHDPIPTDEDDEDEKPKKKATRARGGSSSATVK